LVVGEETQVGPAIHNQGAEEAKKRLELLEK